MAGYIGSTPVPQGIQEQQSFTATAGQTTFNTLGYTDGNTIRVTLNGVLLEGGGVDYTASNGSDIVLTAAASADDVLTFETFNEFQLVSQTMTTPTISGGTLKSNVTLKNDTEQDTDGGRASKIIYQGEQSGGEISTLAEIQASHDGTADDQKADLIFRTNDGSDGTSPTERVRIDSSGNVGIGTTSPSKTLVISEDDSECVAIIKSSDTGTAGIYLGGQTDEIKAGMILDNSTNDLKFQGHDNAERMLIDNNGNVGINESSPDRLFHVNGGTTNTVAKFESTDAVCSIDFTDNGGTAEIGNEGNDIVFFPAGTEKYRILNDGRFKTSDTSYVQFTGTIHSSDTRYYKLINYASGYMLDAVVFMQANRNGGFNQSAGYRNYNCAVGGYSNALYGPITATGDSGESGNMTLHAGSDEAIYLKITPNTYGGTVNGVIIGRIRTWDYDGTYVTSAP